MQTLLSEIRRKIRTRDNGPAVDAMRKLGINYKTIHGLSIAEIKAIAQTYAPNNDLAIELRGWDHREFKILATFIQSYKTLTWEQLLDWEKELKNIEICEQLSYNLIFPSPLAIQFVEYSFTHVDSYVQKTGLITLSWLARKSTETPSAWFEQKIPQLRQLLSDNVMLAKGISLALRTIGRRSKALNQMCLDFVSTIDSEQWYANKLIVTEAQWELESFKETL